jgi:hypothetical protein
MNCFKPCHKFRLLVLHIVFYFIFCIIMINLFCNVIFCCYRSVKCMADKSTKTDDALLNGELVCTSTTKPSTESARPSIAAVVGGRASVPPTTTNASTMTSHVLTESRPTAPASAESVQSSSVAACSRPSYAQVAQHHRERAERLQREKQQQAGTTSSSGNDQEKRKSDPDGSVASTRQPELRGMFYILFLLLLQKIISMSRQVCWLSA